MTFFKKKKASIWKEKILRNIFCATLDVSCWIPISGKIYFQALEHLCSTGQCRRGGLGRDDPWEDDEEWIGGGEEEEEVEVNLVEDLVVVEEKVGGDVNNIIVEELVKKVKEWREIVDQWSMISFKTRTGWKARLLKQRHVLLLPPQPTFSNTDQWIEKNEIFYVFFPCSFFSLPKVLLRKVKEKRLDSQKKEKGL